MFRRTFYLEHFLADLVGSEVLRDYCRSRGIVYRSSGSHVDASRWQASLRDLPEERRADIELELAQVNELACRDSIYHLIDVCAQRGLPTELVAGEAAQSLWFLLHCPSVFQEVFFHEEVLEAESWFSARTEPRIPIGDHAQRRAAFERELQRIVAISTGGSRFCASQSFQFDESECVVFVGFVSEHLKFLDAFTEAGRHRRQKLRPASQVLFAYYPSDGTVLLKSRQRAVSKVTTQLRAFCRAVLGSELDERSIGQCYFLDRLLEPFDPPLPPGIAQARVKALELAYPASEGRRRLRLETNAADGQFAIRDLLAAHVGREGERRLRVVEAEIQVTLVIRGRSKNCFIRLWPHRCTLNQTPTAETLRRCLIRWGLTHEREP